MRRTSERYPYQWPVARLTQPQFLLQRMVMGHWDRASARSSWELQEEDLYQASLPRRLAPWVFKSRMQRPPEAAEPRCATADAAIGLQRWLPLQVKECHQLRDARGWALQEDSETDHSPGNQLTAGRGTAGG